MATLVLHSQKTLDQAAITAGTAKLTQNRVTLVHGATDTLQMPLQCDVGYSFNVVGNGFVVTLAAQTGETIAGDLTTSAAVGSAIHVVKSAATAWVGAFITGGAAVA